MPQGFPEKQMNKLEDYGFIQSRPRGEYHANNQQMSKLLHKAIGLGNRGAAPQARALRHARPLLRTCMSLASARASFLVFIGLLVQPLPFSRSCLALWAQGAAALLRKGTAPRQEPAL